MRHAVLMFLGVGLCAAPALAGPPARPTAPQLPAPAVMPMGRSVGSPTEGHLIGGAHLPNAPYLRIVPAYAQDNERYGLGALIGLIDRAGRRLSREFPNTVLSVGDISRSGGGEIERHASHESGRDADLAFFVTDQRGHSIFADHFVAFRPDGTAPTWPGAKFDDARNWALVAAVLEDPIAHVTHIFVSGPLRYRLLVYAQQHGVPEPLRTRAAFAMVQPRGSLPHDDHFHVRIGCPPGMTSCIENPVIHARRHPTHTRRAQADHADQAATAHPDHGPEPRSGEVRAPQRLNNETTDALEGDGG